MAKRTSAKDEYLVRELRVGNRREAELLADMWNRSDEGWPGGWTGGVPMTAERVLRDFMRWDCYAQWVVEHAGETVGYVNLLADPGDPRHAYVGLLNARPDHHGRGVGRRLMRQALRRAIEAGFERVEIHTWPANLKAVPLYKKTGFFWSPETSVDMSNFIPTIVRMPLLADFFARHDWYQVQERDLSVCEDVEHWHGVRVYRYRFAADGRAIEVVVDRQAAMPTAVETDDVYVAAWAGAEDLAALREHVLRYELVNKAGRPMSVSVLARGETGVTLSLERSFTLRKRQRLAVPFRLPADLERKRPGLPPHRVLSTVTVDGVPVRLGTSVRMRDPVEIQYGGQGMAAGRWSEVFVKLRNRLPFPVRGVLWLGSGGEVERDREVLEFRIPRNRWGCASFRARVPAPGAYPVDLRVVFADETARRLAKGKTATLPPRGRVRTVWLRAFRPGTFASSADAESREVTVEGDTQMLVFRRVGGRLTFRNKTPWRDLLGLEMPELGPPFGQFRPIPEVYDADVEQADGGVRLTTRSSDGRHPGLTVERTVLLSAGVLELRHRLINGSDQPYETKVLVNCWGHIGAGRYTLPERDGLVQHQRAGWGDWPSWGELRRPTEQFGESWVAADEEGMVAGVVWAGRPEVSPNRGGGAEITCGPVKIPARATAELPPVYLVGGRGDWKAVRAVWEHYVHPERLATPEEREPDVRKLLRGGLSESPAMIEGRSRRLTVELVSQDKRPATGEARLELPSIVTLGSGKGRLAFPVRGLRADEPVRRRVTLAPRAKAPTAAQGELVLTTQRDVRRFPVPIIIVRTGRANLKLRHDDDTVSVDTGRVAFRVSAAHGGTMVSLRSRGRELLSSSYPKPRPYWWMNPWYGGVRPIIGSDWDRRLHAARRTIRPVALTGASGRKWQGALVRKSPAHADFQWLRYEAQYLGTAGSNLVAVTIRAERTSPAPEGLNVGADVWPRKDAGRAYVEREGELCPYTAEQFEYSVGNQQWVAFACGRAGHLALVPRREPAWRVSVQNVGDGQLCANVGHWADLTPPVSSLTSMLWLVPCRSLEEAHAYRFLKELRELP